MLDRVDQGNLQLVFVGVIVELLANESTDVLHVHSHIGLFSIEA